MRFSARHSLLVPLLCAAALPGCSNSDGASGTVSVSLMDRSVDHVAELWITVSEVWLKPAGNGPAFMLPLTVSPVKTDLLALDDQNAYALVNAAVVPPGDYNWVELRVEDADISQSFAINEIGGMEPVDIDVPSGKIRLVSGFTVGPNQAVRLLLDWDVRKGLTDAVGRDGYLLRPAFRILDADELGAISGNIRQSRFDGEGTCTSKANADIGNVVYVFADGDPVNDFDGAAPEPVTTADAVPSTNGGYDYRVAVMPGDYTLAFTCQGMDDNDLADDLITFLSPTGALPINVTLSAEITGVDF